MMWCLHVPQQRVQIHRTGEDEQLRKHTAKREAKGDGEHGVGQSAKLKQSLVTYVLRHNCFISEQRQLQLSSSSD